MEEAKNEKVTVDGVADVISKLPDTVLAAIISFLPVANEAVRTSVLSRSWREMWRYTSHLSFDQKRMLKPAVRTFLYFSDPNWPVAKAGTYTRSDTKILHHAIDEAAGLINSVLDLHCGSLISCQIVHLIESCKNGCAVAWIRKLLEEKGVQELFMECEFCESWYCKSCVVRTHALTLDLPFDILSRFPVLQLKNYVLKVSAPFKSSQILKTLKFRKISLTAEILEGIISNCLSLENLSIQGCMSFKKLKVHSPSIKILVLGEMIVSEIDITGGKLEVIEVDTMVCNSKGVYIDGPKLRVFRSLCDLKCQGIPNCGYGRILLTTREIMETCNNLVCPEGSGHVNIFENLVTLCIDLDLNNVRDVIPLSFVLRICLYLQNLEINNQDIQYVEISENDPASQIFGVCNNSQDYCLPCPRSMFWKRRNLCDCVGEKLKTVCLTGYKGSELEVEFVKYLITNSRVMERITIWFDHFCTWEGATTTTCLLSLARASENMFITLKPGKQYLAEVGGSLEEWISTLRVN